jgi:hypothetical protein
MSLLAQSGIEHRPILFGWTTLATLRQLRQFAKAALAAAKRKGRKLGTAGSVETAARARAARSEQATKAKATTRAVIAEIQRAGRKTLAAKSHGNHLMHALNDAPTVQRRVLTHAAP